MQIAFDNDKYIRIQSEHIRERIAQFGNKLYLELGGKLFDDMHASRVLPGFQPDSKLQMLTQLRDNLEIVIVISASTCPPDKGAPPLAVMVCPRRLVMLSTCALTFSSCRAWISMSVALPFISLRG